MNKKMTICLCALAVITLICVGCSQPKGMLINKIKNVSISKNINKVGNWSGNSVNGGKCAKQGDWIYYCKTTDNGDSSENYLCKMKTDGTDQQTLIQDGGGFRSLNVIGDWIYYSFGNNYICKIKTDGTGQQKLADKYTYLDIMDVQGDWIYETKFGCDDILKMKTDGTSQQRLDTYGQLGSMVVQDDWIYFSSDKGLCKMKTDGTSYQKLDDTDSAITLNVQGDWIYYVTGGEYDDGNLYKLKTDGTDKGELLNAGDNKDIKFINVQGDWIYYVTGGKNDNYGGGDLCKIRTNGTDKQQLIHKEVSSDKFGYSYIYTMNVIDDWIYYEDDGNNWRRIKTNGMDNEEKINN